MPSADWWVGEDCPTCRGQGEVAVPGTYGPTISRERLELERCPDCGGTGEKKEGSR